MDTKTEIDLILSKLSEEAHEMVDTLDDLLTAEEIVIAAMEIVTNTPVTTIEYSSPLGTVDKTRVSFMIDEEFECPLYEEYLNED